MKIRQTVGLLTLGIALVSATGWAQTTPTGAATSTTYPAGAVVSDSATSAKPSRSQRRAMKRSRRATNGQRTGSGGQAGSQEGQARQSSAANGTAINNSNSTNYNSNNATNNPTGVGSNPSTTGASTSTPPNPGGQPGSGQTNSAGGSSSSTGSGNSMNSGAAKTGTGAAVAGARTSETPAVKAGSTVRNTSIGDFIASSPNYITLQNALQSAELSETLKGTGPYTIFAPSNSAFKKLPATVQGSLLEGRNREALKQLLSYHVVNGSVDAAELTRQIKSSNGKAKLQTLAGGTLTAQMGANDRVMLMDEQGGTAYVETADAYQLNGVVHGISTVLMPKAGASAFR